MNHHLHLRFCVRMPFFQQFGHYITEIKNNNKKELSPVPACEYSANFFIFYLEPIARQRRFHILTRFNRDVTLQQGADLTYTSRGVVFPPRGGPGGGGVLVPCSVNIIYFTIYMCTEISIVYMWKKRRQVGQSRSAAVPRSEQKFT